MTLWRAEAPASDLREAVRTPLPMARLDSDWEAAVPLPGSGYVGVFVEAVFLEGVQRLYLSSSARLILAAGGPASS